MKDNEWYDSVLKRFWSKVDRRGQDDCWEWTAHISGHGYGMFSWRHGINIGAHCAAWMLMHGESIPHGMQICHSCSNPLCCNPSHLRMDTPRNNTIDALNAGTSREKLTVNDVRELRRLYAGGGITQKVLADCYGVCQPRISNIVNLLTWEHVQ